MRWLTLVLVLTACSSTPTRPLAELRGKEVFLGWTPEGTEPEQLRVFVELDYQVDECVAVDATATLDGRPLEVFERGSSGEDQHGDPFCARPGWMTTVLADGHSTSTITIQIADETAAITYELVNPFAERTVQASTGGSMSLSPGTCFEHHGLTGDLVLPPNEEVTLSWSPATDKITAGSLVGRSDTAGQIFYLIKTELPVDGSTIRFVAPANSTQATRAKLEGSFAPATRRCEGADACRAGTQYCGEFFVSGP